MGIFIPSSGHTALIVKTTMNYKVHSVPLIRDVMLKANVCNDNVRSVSEQQSNLFRRLLREEREHGPPERAGHINQ